jgi:hypothetical protein
VLQERFCGKSEPLANLFDIDYFNPRVSRMNWICPRTSLFGARRKQARENMKPHIADAECARAEVVALPIMDSQRDDVYKSQSTAY